MTLPETSGSRTFSDQNPMSQNHLSDLRFDALDIHEQVQAGIRDAGFEFCTPIQASTLPIALAGHDVAGQAQTGTGKTAAFLISTYQRLLASTPAEDGQKQPETAACLYAGAHSGTRRADRQ
jgi:ATP-dependent RNA helicase RhlB